MTTDNQSLPPLPLAQELFQRYYTAPPAPKAQPVQEGWTVYIDRERLRLMIGVQSFDITVDYDEQEPGRLEWFRDMLTKAMSTLSPQTGELSGISGQLPSRIALEKVERLEADGFTRYLATPLRRAATIDKAAEYCLVGHGGDVRWCGGKLIDDGNAQGEVKAS